MTLEESLRVYHIIEKKPEYNNALELYRAEFMSKYLSHIPAENREVNFNLLYKRYKVNLEEDYNSPLIREGKCL